ncbi:MAG: 3'-5' exoribonuclease YhaM family protein [Dehalococcoidia bacterium]
MKSLYVADIEKFSTGQPIEQVVFALADIEVRTSAAGAPYLSLTLTDVTGAIRGVLFDQGTIPTEYSLGDTVVVSGVFNKDYNNIRLQHIQKYEGGIDWNDFLSSSSKDKDEMYRELLATAEAVTNPYLRVLLLDVFGDAEIEGKFKMLPGAKEIHHAYIGGLLEHTLAVIKLCETTAGLYEVDRDLLIAGAMLHDIGKLEELDLKLIVTYTDVGSLAGHSLLGSFFVRDRIRGIEGFPEQLRENLLHIIISHLGNKEWGAIVEPMTLEALLVFMADNTDAKANRYQTLIQQQRPLEQDISPRDYFLGTAVYAPKVQEES